MLTGTLIVLIAFVIIIILGLAIFIDREIYFYEGVHLGPQVQGWLYDRWAAEYDKGKQASQARDAEFIARPLLEALRDVPQPFVIDIATGTGRMPFVLLTQPEFQGHILALDISRGMLEQAAVKLAAQRPGVTLMKYTTLPLPFPDDTFDVVSCLEALEVMPEMETPLAEFIRILRPGGIFISTRGTEASGRKNKVRSVKNFTELLQKTGFEQIQVTPWWKWFDRVLARKPGTLTPAGFHRLTDALHCPGCGAVKMAESATGLQCSACGVQIPVSAEGIILY